MLLKCPDCDLVQHPGPYGKCWKCQRDLPKGPVTKSGFPASPPTFDMGPSRIPWPQTKEKPETSAQQPPVRAVPSSSRPALEASPSKARWGSASSEARANRVRQVARDTVAATPATSYPNVEGMVRRALSRDLADLLGPEPRRAWGWGRSMLLIMFGSGPVMALGAWLFTGTTSGQQAANAALASVILLFVGCVAAAVVSGLTHAAAVQAREQRFEQLAKPGLDLVPQLFADAQARRAQEERAAAEAKAARQAALRAAWRLDPETGEAVLWDPKGAHPEPMDIPVVVRGSREVLDGVAAEQIARSWLHWLGADSVSDTARTRDGGVDLLTPALVVQVKAWAGTKVGIVDVQRTYGIGHAEHRLPVVISTSGFSADAVRWASANNVALLVMDPGRGTLKGASPAGSQLRRTGAS